jgi:hypothetical protein
VKSGYRDFINGQGGTAIAHEVFEIEQDKTQQRLDARRPSVSFRLASLEVVVTSN